jgi:prepilin-type N-terminal cleavage/methylation domain-containing protein
MKNKKLGFTLIEVLIVIGIIAILAAIVIIAINPAKHFAEANNSTRTANTNAILNAIGQYVVENKGLLPTIPNGEINQALCEDIVPDFLPALPTDPKSSFAGKAIVDGECDNITSTVQTNYEVSAVGNRIEVCAPNAADETALENPEIICVTR